jgi:hypothetical protein
VVKENNKPNSFLLFLTSSFLFEVAPSCSSPRVYTDNPSPTSRGCHMEERVCAHMTARSGSSEEQMARVKCGKDAESDVSWMEADPIRD